MVFPFAISSLSPPSHPFLTTTHQSLVLRKLAPHRGIPWIVIFSPFISNFTHPPLTHHVLMRMMHYHHTHNILSIPV